MNVTTEKMQQL